MQYYVFSDHLCEHEVCAHGGELNQLLLHAASSGTQQMVDSTQDCNQVDCKQVDGSMMIVTKKQR